MLEPGLFQGAMAKGFVTAKVSRFSRQCIIVSKTVVNWGVSVHGQNEYSGLVEPIRQFVKF